MAQGQYKRLRPLVEELEPRILYSADTAAALLQPDTLAPSAEVRSLDTYGLAEAASSSAPPAEALVQTVADTAAQAQRQEIVFIDSRVPDAMQLADELMQQRSEGTLYDIVVLNAYEDGTAQINRVLAGERDLAAIHIISHGSGGAIEIGSTRLDITRLAVDAESVARWGQSLAASGDLLLYGCDVAQDASGQAFVQNLARLTGADVAASNDPTGSRLLGGDWDLEYQAGSIEAGLAVHAIAQQQWQGLLPNAAPTLDATKSPTLAAQTEDSGAPAGAVGTLVSSLVDFASPAGQVDNVSDPDAGALLGIAVTAADTTDGSWFYSIDNGANWNPLGAVADNNARLLAADAGTRLYFQPNADYNGTLASAITLRAWDQISGTSGTLSNTNPNGGNKAFSSATDTASLTVTAVNDAPTLGNGTLASVPENTASPAGQTVGTIFSGQFADVDAGASFSGIAVVANTADAGTQGTWQYASDGGSNWFAIGTVADDATALALSSSTLIRFVPVADYNGAPSALTVRGLDNSYAGGFSSTAGSETRANVNTATNGDTTAIAAATANLSTSISAVTPSVTNATTNEDIQTTTGLVISRNAAEVTHFKITGITDGTLYQNDGTTQITNGTFITFAEGNAGLKFTPPADFNGSASFTLRASTSNVDGGLGGSTVNATITVNAVNDAPVRTNGAPPVIMVDEDDASTHAASLGMGGLNYGPGGGSDEAGQTLTYKITAIPSIITLWLANGTTPVVADATLTLVQLRTLKYKTVADASGSANLTFIVQDDGGTANGGVDTLTESLAVTVTAVNDAPTLGNGTLASVPEDTATPAGQTVGTIFTGQFADIDAGASFSGIAVVANTADAATQGTWQYSSDGGSNWFAIGTVPNEAKSLALSSSTLIRFLPVADYNGTPAALLVRGLDNTYADGFSSTAGSETRVSFKTMINGDTTAISAATANLSTSITAVNDTPVDDTPVNVAPVVGRVSLSLSEGQTVTLSGANFDVSDPDDTNFTYTLSAVTGGFFQLSNAAGAAITSFTSTDLASGLVQFVHDGNEAAPTFSVKVNDGDVDSNTLAATINYTPVNGAPVITSDGGGATASISVAENTTEVTTVSATDADLPSQSLRYAISGGADAVKFTIDASTGVLRFRAAPNFEAPTDPDRNNIYQVAVQVGDGNLSTAQALSVRVVDANDAPVLDTARLPVMGVQVEDAGSPVGAAGTLVASLVDFALPAGQVDNVSDEDAGALVGIAVTAADAAHGSWWYSIDGGVDWNTLGDVANHSARVLATDASTRLYFQPDPDWNGTLPTAIAFRAWDQSGASNGSVADTSVPGGASAYSVASASASLIVKSVNDAPQGRDGKVAVAASTSYVFSLADFNVSDLRDSPGDGLAGVLIDTPAASGGLTVSGVAVAAGQFVSAADIVAGRLVFAPATDAGGPTVFAFQFRVQDTGGPAGGGVDIDPTARNMSLTAAAPLPAAEVPDVPPAAVVPGKTVSVPQAPAAEVSDVPPAAVVPGKTASITQPPTAVAVTQAGAGAATLVGDRSDAISSNPASARSDVVPTGGPTAVPSLAGSLQGLVNVVAQDAIKVLAPVVASAESGRPAWAGIQTAGELLETFRRALLKSGLTTDAGAGSDGSSQSPVRLAVGQVPTPDPGADKEPMRFGLSGAMAANVAGIVVSAGFVTWVIQAGGLLTTLLVSVPAWRKIDPLPILAPEEDKPQWRSDEEQEREEAALSGLWNAGTGHGTDGSAR